METNPTPPKQYKHWKCNKMAPDGKLCGHTVLDVEKPRAIRWTDGHVCNFVEDTEET